MKFVCLGYADLSLFASMSEAEMAAGMEECFAYDDQLRAGGHFLDGEALQAANAAVTLRHHNGQTLATDGPFAECKEQIGGILFLEADNMAHAVSLMSKHPGVKYGPFEIRPADDRVNALIQQRNSSSKQDACPEVELLLQVFQDHLGYLEQAVADIDETKFVEQPRGLVNHPAWSLSHLNASLKFLLKLLDDPQSGLTEDEQRRYGAGSVPTTNHEDYQDKAKLLSELRRLHGTVESEVRSKHATYFPRESPIELRSFAPTIGRIATYLLASHESYHLAQINQWRRAAGY